MAEFRLEILSPAWKELDEIASYHLHVVGPISARKITDKILNALCRLEDFPLSCPYAPDAELEMLITECWCAADMYAYID